MKLLPLFGLKNLIDYNNFIKCEVNKIEEEEFILKINAVLNELKSIFPVKRFNLHKTDNKIKSYKQAINILKMCLEIANINYVLDKFNDIKILRLNTTNLYLYKYIEMNLIENSDLRQNDKKINESINVLDIMPGTREAHKTYHTYINDDLRKEIKTANTTHITLCLGHFIKKYNGKNIFVLPLRLININNIYAIKFTPNNYYDIKKNKIVDKYYIIKNEFGYMIEDEFDFYKNLIPNNIIIPLNLSIIESNLYIPLNIDNDYSELAKLIESLYFQIEIVEPIFYKPFQQKLLNEKDCFLVQKFNNKTLLYDFNQQNYILQEEDKLLQIQKEEIKDNDNVISINNQEFKINKIKYGNLDGYETPYLTNMEITDLLLILIGKHCDFIKTTANYTLSMSKFNKFINTGIIYTQNLSDSKYKHILELSFNRYVDTINNIIICPKYGIDILDIANLKIICKFNKFNKKDENNYIFNLQEKNITDNEGDISLFSIKELENKQINLLNNICVNLQFIYESNTKQNILERLYFIYDVNVYDQLIRKNISGLENLIDVNDLQKL